MTTINFKGIYNPTSSIIITFTKDTVDKKDFRAMAMMLSVAKENPYLFCNSMELNFEGYQNDTRPVYEIPEVVDFFRELDAAVPWLLLFINYSQSPDLTPGKPTPLSQYLALSLSAKHGITNDNSFENKWITGERIAEILKEKMPIIMDLFPHTAQETQESIESSIGIVSAVKNHVMQLIQTYKQ